MTNYIKQSLYLLDAKAKKAIPFLIMAFVFSSILDVVGIGLIGIFLGLLTNPSFFLQKFPFVNVWLQGATEKKLIVFAGLLIVGAFIFKAIIALMIQMKTVLFSQSLSVRLKCRMMMAYQRAPYTYHLQKNSAYLLSRIQDNINAYINSVLSSTLLLFSNAIIAFAVLIFLLFLHPFSTVFLIGMFVLVGVGYDFFAKKRLSALSKVAALTSGEMVKSINEGLHGLSEMRVLGREKYFLNNLNRVSNDFAHSYGVLVALQQVPRYLAENAMAIFIVGLSLGGIAAGFDMGSTMAMVGMFAAAGARLLPCITQMMIALNQIRGSYYHMHLICSELNELDALTNHVPKKEQLLDHDYKLSFTDVSLNNICFHYPHAHHAALENVNMTILKGQSIGLIGPSGAGKSTLVNLILGFVKPQQGDLLVNEHPIQDLRGWLNNFAYIPQTIFLLDDTLRRNIAFGIEDDQIDEMRIWNAIKMAQLTEVAHELSQGLDTLLGENGVRLSGGQRQRVALARAFYHERDIIIMDEATSALDSDTENEVINTIKRLKGNKTLIVIAHRLNTVEHCDLLFRLEKGRITTIGTFQEVVGGAT